MYSEQIETTINNITKLTENLEMIIKIAIVIIIVLIICIITIAINTNKISKQIEQLIKNKQDLKDQPQNYDSSGFDNRQ